MEIKRLLLKILFFLFCFLIFAQEEKKSVDKIAENVENPENIENVEVAAQDKWQFLEWEEETPEFVFNYEVVIQECNLETNEWTEIRRNKTLDNTPKIQVNPLLPPGKYRYKIISYNMIGIADIESEWYDFTIYQAFTPKIN